jgi:DNA polymerase III, beta subunit
MKFKVPKSTFLDALTLVQNIVGSRQTLPVLSNALIVAEEGRLVFTTTDLDMTIRCCCDAEVEEQGSVTLPVKKLSAIVRELNDGAVHIETDENATAAIRAGSFRSRMFGLAGKEFPKMPDFENALTYKISQAKLKDMLRKTFYAAAVDNSKPLLTGILLNFENGKLTAVATDGRRLALYETEVDLPEANKKDMVISQRAAAELIKTLGDDGDVVLKFADTQLTFEFNDIFIATKLLSGTYPNYRQVVIQNCANVISINREELLAVVRRINASTTSTASAMRLNFENNILTVTASSSDIGDATDTVAIKYDGEPLSVIFNPEFVIDPLKNLTSDEIQIELNNSTSPGLIKSDIPFLYVIMPLRV